MRTPFVSHTTTSLAILIAAAIHSACHDAPTMTALHPPDKVTAQRLVDHDTGTTAPDSLRRTVQFLPPFGPPHAPPPVVDDSVHALTLTISPLADTTQPPLATFALDVHTTHGGNGHNNQGNARNAIPQPLVRDIHTHAFLAQWTPPKITHAVPLLLTVTLGDSVVQRTSVILITPTLSPAHHTPDDTIRVPWQSTLDIRFFILPPPRSLRVIVEPGVSGSLTTGTRFYRAGQKVPYRFTADPGFTNVLVMIDDDYAPNPGSVTMSSNHTVIVSADRVTSVPSSDAALLHATRDLLTARDAPAAAQRWLDSLADLADTTHLDDRLATIAIAAVDPIADSARLRRLDAALATHALTAGFLTATSPDSADAPSTGVTLTSRAPTHTSTWTKQQTSSKGSRYAIRNSVNLSSTPISLLHTTLARLAEEPATLAFVNGIFTEPLKALIATNTLLRLSQATHFHTATPLTVRLLYNRSTLADDRSPKATLLRCVSALSTRRTVLGVNSLPIFLARCTGRAISDVLHNMQDLQEAARQYFNIVTARNAPEADARAFADSTTRWRNAGQHVVFVPHSQGNMMVQQAVQLLRQTHRYDPPHDSTCLGAVSLAAPLSTHWPIDPPHLAGIVVDGDIILSLQTNHFTPTHTPASDSATADVARWTSVSRVIGAIKRITWGVELHDALRGYLRDATTAPVIQSSLATSLGSCSLGHILLTPGDLTLPLGDSATLTSQLIDANDAPLDGTRRVKWSLSTNTPLATLTTTGTSTTVHTHAIGTAGVTAATGTRATTAALDVTPRTLQLSAIESLSSKYWREEYTGGLLTSPPPQWRDGPDWQGGACNHTLGDNIAGVNVGYVQVCFAQYDVTFAPVPNAARYEARFFTLGSTWFYASEYASEPKLTRINTSPYQISWSGAAPDLVDRIVVIAYDAQGQIIADGATCVHGCVGWPST
jgi:hypothetical protein